MTLRGVVFDSTTGVALVDVAVHLNQGSYSENTDSLGEFQITNLGLGTHTLILAKIGYSPKVFTVSFDKIHQDTIEIGPFSLAPVESITAAVSGTVVDSQTGEPVAGVGVSVNGALATTVGERGFTTGRIEFRPGLNMVEFRRIGYEPYALALWAVRSHTDFDLEVTLDPTAVQMPTVVVEANQTTYVFGTLREFYQRRQWGSGHYFTQQDIEEQKPTVVSDMLRMTPGLVVRPGISGGNIIRPVGFRGLSAPCKSLNFFIDGHYVQTGNDEDTGEEIDLLVHPDNIAAIEAYPRPGQIPVRFKMRGSVCGVIAIWTRR